MSRIVEKLGQNLRKILDEEPARVAEAIEGIHAEDIAEFINGLESEDAIALFEQLNEEVGASVLEKLETDKQTETIQGLPASRVADLLRLMAPDDRVDVLQKLPEEEARTYLTALEREEPEAASEVRELRIYDEDSAGGLMTTDYLSLEPDTKIWRAMEAIREGAASDSHTETIYYTYVCAYGNQLVGVVSLRELILGDPSLSLEHIMRSKVISVGPDDDQEKVARTIAKYDLSAIPVVDTQGCMLGVVTIDDVVDVVIEEATEDAQKVAGVVPLEESYFGTHMFEFVWKRAAWLVVLFLGQLLTTTVMRENQTTLALAMDLVLFVPLIIASGGNSGSQSSSLIIRALAVGEMGPPDWLRVLGRELIIGVSLGGILGLIGFARAAFLGASIDPMHMGIIVGISIVAVVIMGTFVGAMFPLAIRRLGFDPAVASTPFIASLVDVLGLLVYFGVARLALSGLL